MSDVTYKQKRGRHGDFKKSYINSWLQLTTKHYVIIKCRQLSQLQAIKSV